MFANNHNIIMYYKERARFARSLLAPVSKHIAYFTHINFKLAYIASCVETKLFAPGSTRFRCMNSRPYARTDNYNFSIMIATFIQFIATLSRAIRSVY